MSSDRTKGALIWQLAGYYAWIGRHLDLSKPPTLAYDYGQLLGARGLPRSLASSIMVSR